MSGRSLLNYGWELIAFIEDRVDETRLSEARDAGDALLFRFLECSRVLVELAKVMLEADASKDRACLEAEQGIWVADVLNELAFVWRDHPDLPRF